MLNNKEEIIDWLEKYHIKNYIINPDLTIDVNGDVIFDKHRINIKKLPVQFRIVKGSFSVINIGLESLKGCPVNVESVFSVWK